MESTTHVSNMLLLAFLLLSAPDALFPYTTSASPTLRESSGSKMPIWLACVATPVDSRIYRVLGANAKLDQPLSCLVAITTNPHTDIECENCVLTSRGVSIPPGHVAGSSRSIFRSSIGISIGVALEEGNAGLVCVRSSRNPDTRWGRSCLERNRLVPHILAGD